MTLHFAAQYDKLDFGFGTQPLLGFRGLLIQKDAFACVDYFMPVSNSDVERWETSWMINWNECGRKRSWRNRYITQQATWGTEENHENLHLNWWIPWKTTSRVSHEVAEFRTRAPRNTGPYRYNTALLGQDCSAPVFRPNKCQTRTS